MSAVRHLVAADVAEYSNFIAADEVTRRSPRSADVAVTCTPASQRRIAPS